MIKTENESHGDVSEPDAGGGFRRKRTGKLAAKLRKQTEGRKKPSHARFDLAPHLPPLLAFCSARMLAW